MLNGRGLRGANSAGHSRITIRHMGSTRGSTHEYFFSDPDTAWKMPTKLGQLLYDLRPGECAEILSVRLRLKSFGQPSLPSAILLSRRQVLLPVWGEDGDFRYEYCRPIPWIFRQRDRFPDGNINDASGIYNAILWQQNNLRADPSSVSKNAEMLIQHKLKIYENLQQPA